MRIISIMNQKGGTGKTTTTINLGAALAEMGQKVLLVDFDSQANLTFSFALQKRKFDITDFLLGRTTYPQTAEDTGYLHILPSSPRLAELELEMVNWPQRELVLAKKLKELNGYVYDFILIDCPPSRSLLGRNALCASDFLLVPMLLEVLSLEGLNQILELLELVKNDFNPKIQLLGVLPVMVNSSRKVSKEIYDHLKSNFNVPIFTTSIRTDVRVVEAPSFGKPVLKYSSDSPASWDYRSAANEILEAIKN